jgi:hypothetical protein
MPAFFKSFFKRFFLRLFYLSISVSDSGFGETWVAVTRARSKKDAGKMFYAWMIKDKLRSDWAEHFLKTSLFEEDEFTKEKICLDPLSYHSPNFVAEERKVNELKEKAALLENEAVTGKVVELYYNRDHT